MQRISITFFFKFKLDLAASKFFSRLARILGMRLGVLVKTRVEVIGRARHIEVEMVVRV